MAKQVKKVYKFLAWLLAVVLASGTFIGCRGKKYEQPISKYGPPSASGYQNNRVKGNNVG